MERKKYWLMLFFAGLSVLAPAQKNYGTMVYHAFVSGEMNNWEKAIDQMEKEKVENSHYLLDLINFQYGYIGWCLGNDKKKAANHYLDLMENNLEVLKALNGETADYHAYHAAAYGFRIGLKKWRAPFLGPKSMDHAEKALDKNPESFQANMEMGNIWNHMPEMFGGSYAKAMNYYLNALNIIEKTKTGATDQNWMYLNLLAIAGQMEAEEGNKDQAILFYEKALKIEPEFKWIQNELLPSLKNK